MTPSDIVYHRILWDPRFDATRWVLGVEVRAPAPKPIPLVDFVPGGELPWHRVLYFAADGVVIWDRRDGTDRLDTCEVGRAEEPEHLPEGFGPRHALAWDGAAWSPAAPADAPLTTVLKVLTWNVLFDRYDDGALRSAERRGLLTEILANEAAERDVMALQEVQFSLLQQLLAHPTFRDGWSLVLPGPPRGVDHHGLALWSRRPVRAAGFLRLGPHKGVLAAVIDGPAGPVRVATTHLTSDHSSGAARKRGDQLSMLRAALDQAPAPSVVMGDFNDEGDGPVVALGLRDLAHGTHESPTFDPERNPLAAIGSRTGRPRRLDRVLASPGLSARTLALRGTSPDPTGLHPSDHFAVAVDLVATPLAHDALPHAPDRCTALCWLPPDDVQRALEPVRSAHDPAAERWPAHVNLRFGFVPEHAFEAAAAQLSDALAPLAPVGVGLDVLQHWPGRRPTWSLDPTGSDPAGWRALEAALAPLFPALAAGRPHLTLSRGTRPRLGPLPEGVMLQEVHLLSRRGDGPMARRATVPLGGGPVVWHDPMGPAQVEMPGTERTEAVERWVAEVRRLLQAHGGKAHVVGSWGVGVPLADSDLDLVAVLPVGATQAVADALLALHPGRQVVAARVPGVQLQVDDLPVDVALVEVHDVRDAVAARHTSPDEGVARALAGIADASLLAAALDSPAQRQAAREIKGWARARGLDQRPLGGLPPLGWLVLVARVAHDHGDLGRAARFEALADALQRPVALHEGWTGAEGVAALQVCVPAPPYRPCSDGVTESMARRIGDELVRAWSLASEGSPWSVIAAPVPWRRQHAVHLLLVPEDADAAGLLRGRVRGLLGALEEAGALGVHALANADGTVRVGLGRQPLDERTLTRILAAWRPGAPGVHATVRR